MKERIILHIDFDSFFASVEQQYNPTLRGKPVGVTATNGRTCIIAASRQAKSLGIKSPSRTFEAQSICPTLLLTPAHFWQYAKISKQFLFICSEYSPYVEMFSIDEVFMDVTKTAYLFGGVDNLVLRIKERIKKQIGEYITASFGISYNKLLAKIASSYKKPNGIFTITKENFDAVYKTLPLTAVCGIGFRIATRLQQLGIYSLPQLKDTQITTLIQEFGTVEGKFLQQVGLGIDTSAVIPYAQAPQVKSVGRNYCLPRNEYDQRIILQHIYELCEEVTLKLRRLSKKAQTIGLSLRGSHSAHATKTGDYIDNAKDMFAVCKYFYDTWEWHNQMVRQISLWSSNLVESNSVSLSLFDGTFKKDRLQKTIDVLNERFGDHTIRNGFLHNGEKLTTVPNGFGADRYERIKIAQEALLFKRTTDKQTRFPGILVSSDRLTKKGNLSRIYFHKFAYTKQHDY